MSIDFLLHSLDDSYIMVQMMKELKQVENR